MGNFHTKPHLVEDPFEHVFFYIYHIYFNKDLSYRFDEKIFMNYTDDSKIRVFKQTIHDPHDVVQDLFFIIKTCKK